MRIFAWVETKVTHGPTWVRLGLVSKFKWSNFTGTTVTIVRTLVPDEVAHKMITNDLQIIHLIYFFNIHETYLFPFVYLFTSLIEFRMRYGYQNIYYCPDDIRIYLTHFGDFIWHYGMYHSAI